LYKNGAAAESFPSKVYEIMASGRPLLASSERDSEVEYVISSSGCGVCVRPGKSEQLTEAILNLYRNPSLCTTMGQLGRRYVEENHSMRAAVARYHGLFRAVCG
jgi:colanic acid biosynthesis glycosyl transferase WcaI